MEEALIWKGSPSQWTNFGLPGVHDDQGCLYPQSRSRLKGSFPFPPGNHAGSQAIPHKVYSGSGHIH